MSPLSFSLLLLGFSPPLAFTIFRPENLAVQPCTQPLFQCSSYKKGPFLSNHLNSLLTPKQSYLSCLQSKVLQFFSFTISQLHTSLILSPSLSVLPSFPSSNSGCYLSSPSAQPFVFGSASAVSGSQALPLGPFISAAALWLFSLSLGFSFFSSHFFLF